MSAPDGDLDARAKQIEEYVREIGDAFVGAAKHGLDVPYILSRALGRAADELGSPQKLTVNRPDAWESRHVIRLAIEHARTRGEVEY